MSKKIKKIIIVVAVCLLMMATLYKGIFVVVGGIATGASDHGFNYDMRHIIPKAITTYLIDTSDTEFKFGKNKRSTDVESLIMGLQEKKYLILENNEYRPRRHVLLGLIKEELGWRITIDNNTGEVTATVADKNELIIK